MMEMNYPGWLRLIELYIELGNLLNRLNYESFECVDFKSEIRLSVSLRI